MSSLRSVLFGVKPEYYWLSLLIFLGVVVVIILSWKRLDFASVHEGFQQEAPYLYVTDVHADPLYISMYDRLQLPADILDNVVTQVVELTQPSKRKSTLLDLGSGTGTLAASLARRGYTVYGIDRSAAMVEHANKLYDDIPTVQYKQADWSDPMLWESGSFTHVLCTGFTFYSIADAEGKRRLLENSYHWLKPGGYLVMQLVDAQKFSAIIPGGRPPIPVQSRERITNTVIDFVDFEYKAGYTFPTSDSAGTTDMVLRESFVDGLTKNVRILEQKFQMMSVKDVLAMATRVGFAGQGYAALTSDPHQYLYVFVKPA